MNITVDGKSVYAYTARKEVDPAQRSVVFLHGAANDHGAWNLQSRYFAYHGWNSLAVDLPAHGRSEGPALRRIEDFSAWTMKLLDALAIEKATLVGHSMGSLIALDGAANYLERVEKLVMIGTVVPMPVSKVLLDTSKANDHAALDMINIWGHGAAAQLGSNTLPGVWMMGNNLRLIERAGPGVLHADFQACNNYTVGLENAERVRCPSLLLLGERDQMTPAKPARELATRLKGSKTVILKGVGHSLMGEDPNGVLDALIDFLG